MASGGFTGNTLGGDGRPDDVLNLSGSKGWLKRDEGSFICLPGRGIQVDVLQC